MKRSTLAGFLAVIITAIGGVLLLTSSNTGPASANISPAQYQSQFSTTPHFLLDVRTPEEFATGHISGAANISVQTLAARLAEVPKDEPVVVYCRSGNRSATAVQMLKEAGYTTVYDLGGVIAWTAAGLPLE